MRITIPRSGKRPRIQFYLTDELERMWSSNREIAKQLRLRIDFQDAFRLWFLKENKEARECLERELKLREEHEVVAD